MIYGKDLKQTLNSIADELARNIGDLIRSRVWKKEASKEEMAEMNITVSEIAKSLDKLRKIADRLRI